LSSGKVINAFPARNELNKLVIEGGVTDRGAPSHEIEAKFTIFFKRFLVVQNLTIAESSVFIFSKLFD